MKTKPIYILVFFFVLFILQETFCQNPLVKQWDYRFGGNDFDVLASFQQTADGGYILGGYSQSGISGNKAQNIWGGYDYWVIKIDSIGNKQWDKDFGGTSNDCLTSLQQTADGGYILGGFSYSDSSGDKTQNSWGYADYWVVKIDSLGNKQWDKDFGGTDYDLLYSLQQTADGGFILGGYSQSGISGDKTQDTIGSYDYWIVKIDSLGNKQWDKDFGGTGNERFYSLQQTADGGYILGGYSQSDISGDKTQNSWGSGDYWIVKIDSLGNKLWDKDFGGTNDDALLSLLQTTDGGYILAGNSISGISGDKTQNTWGGYDYWIVKIDSLGNKQWDKDFGGTEHEDWFGNVLQIGNVSQTADGGYLVAGASYSPISGDKTENNLGTGQSWMIKFDSLGNKQWDKTMFTNTHCHDDMGLAIQTKDGCIAMANYTQASTGGYKTQPNWDLTQASPDFWIIKFCDTTVTTVVPTILLPSEEGMMVAPDPVSDKVMVSSTNSLIDKIEVLNILGEVVYQSDLNAPKTEINVSSFDNGIYIINVFTQKGMLQKKLVVNH